MGHLIKEDEKATIQNYQAALSAAKAKGISLCGIETNATTANFSNEYLASTDAILIANDLTVDASVTAVRQPLVPNPLLLEQARAT